MKGQLTPQQRIVLRSAAARAQGADPKVKKKPITLAKVPKRDGK